MHFHTDEYLNKNFEQFTYLDHLVTDLLDVIGNVIYGTSNIGWIHIDIL